MSPNYGSNEKPDDHVVPDWLLGGNRKRRVLAALATPHSEHGWTVEELVNELACGRSTVYEIVRALRPLGVLADVDGRLRLDAEAHLGQAIAAIVEALEPHEAEAVDRPPRARHANSGGP